MVAVVGAKNRPTLSPRYHEHNFDLIVRGRQIASDDVVIRKGITQRKTLPRPKDS
jgi:hypothetical protein